MPTPLAFHDLHGGRLPWDTGAPQPALLALTKAGELRGRVLDIGCGAGEHTLMAAAAGLDATGVDLAAGALENGARNALERGLTARFLCHDALRLSDLGELFDTALDSLLLHALDPAVRTGYLSEVRAVLRPGGRLHVLCYSDQHTGDPDLPHKMSRAELESCFSSGWDLESLLATTCATNLHPGGAAAWLATCRRSLGRPAMPSATARVATSRADRYLTHLCEHTSKLSQHTSLTRGHDRAGPLPQQAHWSGTDGVIDFGNGRCTLHATSEALEIRAEAADTQLLLRIQDALTGRLEQIGRRDHLTITWTQVPTERG